MDDVAIRLEKVSKYYKLYNSPGDRLKEALNPFGKIYHKDFYALKNINLEIKKGEILGIVGKNGCGKSTLLKLMSKVLAPNEGNLAVNGKVSALLELGAGFNPEFTGIKNIYFYGTILGFTRKQVDEMLDSILSFAEIGEFIYQPLKTYSSGMKARLAFAVAVNVSPDILILDEVMAVGDEFFRRKCYRKMQEFFKQGKTVIFVSHSTQAIIEFCTRAILLYEREIILDGDPKQITDIYQKLIFSKDKVNVLDEINESTKCVLPCVTDSRDDALTFGESYKRNTEKYIEGLSIESREIINSDITLQAIYILDKNNDIVNQLETGENYKVFIKINIDKPYKNLTFGIAISNTKGLSISCTRENLNDRANINNKCSSFRFLWKFRCNLLTGRYFVKVDFRGGVSDLYFQSTDSLVFEVDSVTSNKYQKKLCIVDLDQSLEMIK